MPGRKRPDIGEIAARHPPPPLSGRGGLFAVPSGGRAQTAAERQLSGSSTPDAPGGPASHNPKGMPAGRRVRRTPPGMLLAMRTASLERRSTADVEVERSYVLGTEHDRMLHELAVVTGLTVKAVAQEALARHLDRFDGQDLRALDAAPFDPGPGPPNVTRRTIAIRAEHDRILRSLRMLYRLQASDMVRQAIAGYYGASRGG